MMRLTCLLLSCLLFSCASQHTVPALQAIEGNRWGEKECSALFISGNWQFVHSIAFRAGGGHEVTLMGVTVLHGATIKSVLMGVEGFVLFEAEEDSSGEITVERALPPFDSAHFAEGLLRDVRMLFFEPEAEKQSLLQTAEQIPVCRYHTQNGTTDVMPSSKGWSHIRQYDLEARLVKSTTASRQRNQGGVFLPEKIAINSSGAQGYTLQLQLLSADPI